jgi:NTP pyrophosphatase (non-canonical NTP hydrolase)
LDWLLLKLVEENGEFANALLVYTKKCRKEKMVSNEVAKDDLSKELVDIFTTTILLADRLDIDLLKSLDEKVLQKAQEYLNNQG